MKVNEKEEKSTENKKHLTEITKKITQKMLRNRQ